MERHHGLMVSVFVSGLDGPGSSPGWEHCVVFLGKTLLQSQCHSPPRCKMSTGELNAGGNPAMD